MTKTMIACIGFLLFAMHFSSQVHALNSTSPSPVLKENVANVTTTNITISKGASASLQFSAFTLLIPVAGSLIQGSF